MNKQEPDALDRLLDYVGDEEKDFEDHAAAAGDPVAQKQETQHIYRSIYVLMRYRSWDLSKHTNPAPNLNFSARQKNLWMSGGSGSLPSA
jgi:hypothetical protein